VTAITFNETPAPPRSGTGTANPGEGQCPFVTARMIPLATGGGAGELNLGGAVLSNKDGIALHVDVLAVDLPYGLKAVYR
jgi:hypothetical protein